MNKQLMDGKITLLVNSDETTIEVEDVNSRLSVIKIKLTPEQLSQALSRLSSTPCQFQFNDSGLIGKIHKCKKIEFELPDELQGYSRDDGVLHLFALTKCSDGWVPDKYFGSQDSFFTKDGRRWARCTIRRWV